MSLRVLVVDDDAAVRRSITRVLTARGYTVIAVADSHSAYAMLGETEVDAVLIDVNMPEMRGDTLYVALVRRWAYLKGRIVLMSGDIWSARQSWSEELCRLPTLEKPFTMDQVDRLLAALVAALEPRRRGNGSTGA